MTNTLKQASATERVITVGDVNIVIKFDYKLTKDDKRNIRLYGIFNNEYSIEIECRFGKSSFNQHYAVTANDIEDVVEYFRNKYRGKAIPSQGLVHIIPYSWE